MAMYSVEVTINGEESELLLEFLANLTAVLDDPPLSTVDVTVRKLDGDEEEDSPHCLTRQRNSQAK